MKTYTLTWKHSSFYGSTLSRCRFDPSAVIWPFMLQVNSEPVTDSPVLAFMHLCCSLLSSCSYRLSSCGRLVARQATYNGVA